MNDRPLFGSGSSTSKHAKNRTGFLRPAPASDGRLHSTALQSQATTNIARANGTKSDRKTPADIHHAPGSLAGPVANPAPGAVAAPIPAATPAPIPAHSPVADAGLAPTEGTTAPAQGAIPAAFPVIKQEGNVEDRKGTRRRALKGALIIRPGQMMSSYACKIRNESSGGVMLILSDALLVPPEFYLIRDADPCHKIPCRVAWREKDSLGVEFVPALSAP